MKPFASFILLIFCTVSVAQVAPPGADWRSPDFKYQWEYVQRFSFDWVPYQHWYNHIWGQIGSIRYDFPPELTENGAPGCQSWDEDSPNRSGPVYSEHIMQADYIIFKAPQGHRISWVCQGFRKRKNPVTPKAAPEQSNPVLTGTERQHGQ